MRTYQKNGKLALAMQAKMKEAEEAMAKKSEELSVKYFPNREDAIQAFKNYFDV